MASPDNDRQSFMPQPEDTAIDLFGSFDPSNPTVFSRTRLEEQVQETRAGFEALSKNEHVLGNALIDHVQNLAEIPGVLGVIYRMNPHDAHYVNMLTVASSNDVNQRDQFKAIMNADSKLHQAFGAYGLGSGSSLNRHQTDFDEFLKREIQREKDEKAGIKPTPTANPLAQLLRELNTGYRTVSAFKFTE